MGLLVVALTGARRSGKDVVAEHLCRVHGFDRISFADPLKQMVAAAFGFSWEQVDGHSKDVVDDAYGITPRKVLQFMGTEVMQLHLQTLLPEVGRNFWAARLVREHVAQSRDDRRARLVISDMRFKHEYDVVSRAVASCGGNLHVWQVTRPDKDKLLQDASLDCHASECEWTTIPSSATLSNNGTLQDLFDRVDTHARPITSAL